MPRQPKTLSKPKSDKQAGPRIALLDSGVGGLSIAVPLSWQLAQQKQVSIDYLADTAYYPYGTKAQPELIRRVLAVVAAYLTKHPDCQQLIVACNTASTLCLDALRDRFALPIIGVVPALKPACASSQKPAVGLLATKATVNRHYIDELMAKFGQGKKLVKVGSQSLVNLAEHLLKDPEAPASSDTVDMLRQLNTELEPLRRAFNGGKLDTIVLGCTHFPWLKATLHSLLPSRSSQDLKFLDSTEAIIRRSLEVAGLSAAAPADLAENIQLPLPRSIAGCYFITKPSCQTSFASELFATSAHLPISSEP